MACGLAVVGSRTGGTPEVIGDAGLLFDRDGLGELVSHLDHLLSDSSRRNQYANEARERAQAFSWDHTWRKIQSLIADSGAGHSSRAIPETATPSLL
jgi:glycosyltransferase involved in cell wall biosynthesis